MGRWSDTATWTGDGLRREVFFFPSGGVELYGSLYASAAPTREFGVVVCGSWGAEADRSDPMAHDIALATARLGGAGLVFHYPGFGDSYGDLAAVTTDALVTAAADAAAEAARRSAATEWLLAGYTFGASIACLARPLVDARGLLLLQPALRPSAYFERLTRRAGPRGPGAGKARIAFGYPIPERIVDRGAVADAAVEAALAEYQGGGAAIRYEAPVDQAPFPLPETLEQIAVPGRWRFGARYQHELLAAATEWLASCPIGAAEAAP